MFADINIYARKGLEAELERLNTERDRVMALLASLDGSVTRRQTPAAAQPRRPRQMSEAGRQAIREAVKRRWERARAAAAASTDGAGGKAEDASVSASPKRSRRATRTGNRKK